MANTFAPTGFDQYNGTTGGAPTFDMVEMAIKSTNTTAIFAGDPVIQATGTTGLGTGYITQAVAPSVSTVSAGTLTAGVMVLTYSGGNQPQVGSYITNYGFTSTAATVNGSYLVTASTSTTVSFNFSGAFTTGTGSFVTWTPIVGVFAGCKYLSTAQKRTLWMPYFPGSDAAADVTAYVISNPGAQFIVQTGNSNTTATAVGLSSFGQNIGFNYSDSAKGGSNGNTNNGLSTYFADQYTLGANYVTGYPGQPYLPFKIVGFANNTIGATSPLVSGNGNDITTAYNSLIVGFNNAMLRSPVSGL